MFDVIGVIMLPEEKNANDLESNSPAQVLFLDITVDNYHRLFPNVCMLISILICQWGGGREGLFVCFCK